MFWSKSSAWFEKLICLEGKRKEERLPDMPIIPMEFNTPFLVPVMGLIHISSHKTYNFFACLIAILVKQCPRDIP